MRRRSAGGRTQAIQLGHNAGRESDCELRAAPDGGLQPWRAVPRSSLASGRPQGTGLWRRLCRPAEELSGARRTRKILGACLAKRIAACAGNRRAVALRSNGGGQGCPVKARYKEALFSDPSRKPDSSSLPWRWLQSSFGPARGLQANPSKNKLRRLARLLVSRARPYGRQHKDGVRDEGPCDGRCLRKALAHRASASGGTNKPNRRLREAGTRERPSALASERCARAEQRGFSPFGITLCCALGARNCMPPCATARSRESCKRD